MADALIAKTIGVIMALPPSANPYAVLKEMLPPYDMPDWFFRVLYTNYVIAGLGLLASLATISGRIARRTFWLFHVRSSPSCGSLLLPNTVVLLSIWSGLYFVSSILSSYFLSNSYKNKKDPLQGWLYQNVIFVQIMLCLWTQAWSCTGAAVLLYEPASGSRLMQRQWVGPVISGLFIFGCLLSVSLFPGVQGHYMAQMSGLSNNWNDVQGILSGWQSRWQPGQSFIPDPAWTSIATQTSNALSDAIPWNRRALYIYGSILLSQMLLVALPASLFYIRILRKQIASTRVTASHQQTLRSSVRNYKLLIAETVVVLALGVCYIAAGYWMGSNAEAVVIDPYFASISITVLLLPFGSIAATISAILAVYTIFQIRSDKQTASRATFGSRVSDQLKQQSVNVHLSDMSRPRDPDGLEKDDLGFERNI